MGWGTVHGVRARQSKIVLKSRLAGIVGAAVVAPMLACLPVAPAAADSTTFDTPGTYTYTVPPDATSIAFTVSGSQGGFNGGAGGTVTGRLVVSPGQTFTVDVGDWVPRKIAAVLCHRTQMGIDNPFTRLDPADARKWLGTEYFRRLEPHTGSAVLELFGQPGFVS